MRLGLVLLAPFAALGEPLLSAGGPLPVIALLGVLGAAFGVAAVLAMVLLVPAVCGLAGSGAAARLEERSGTRVLVWLRNPDAAGHVRSRAPGTVLPAA